MQKDMEYLGEEFTFIADSADLYDMTTLSVIQEFQGRRSFAS